MPAISSAGIGSGLDVQGIVSQLMALERRPLQRLQFKQGQLESQISAYGSLNSTLSSFKDAMDKLGSLDALKVFTSSSSNPGVIDITASSSANLATFDVEVLRLAENHKLSSDTILKTTVLGGGAGDSLTIQVGSDVADVITIDMSSGMTLQDIRTALNNDVNNPGVHATVINGDNDNQKIVFTADDSGADNALTFSYGGSINASTLNLQTLNNIAGDTSLLNAEIVIDGFNITRSSNNIADAISGVTLNLISANPGNAHTLDIDRDLETVETSVQEFADAYNALRSSIKSLRSGQLEADSSLLSIERGLLSVLNTPAAGGVFSTLSEIGLSIQKDGNLTLSNSDLQTALQNDFEGVSQLFSADTQGFANRFSTLADNWIGSNGLLEARTDGLENRVDNLVDQQFRLERNLETTEARFLARFSALDALVGQLQGTSNFLTSQLAQLPGSG